jgi:hypothetical protein
MSLTNPCLAPIAIERWVMAEDILMKINAMPKDFCKTRSIGVYDPIYPIIEVLCGISSARNVRISAEMRRILQSRGVPTDVFANDEP